MTTSRSKLPSYDDALAAVLAHAPPLGAESVPLSQALGRVLRQAVRADRDQPPFDRSAMDGFAVRAGEVSGRVQAWPIAGVVAAGSAAFAEPLQPGTVKRIATGAPLPPQADAVVPVEQAHVEGDQVRFTTEAVAAWQNVHRRAADARQGEVVIAAGTTLGPQHVGIAAAVGSATLSVAQRPRVVLLTTGDEVMPYDTATEALEPQQIRNSNGPMLTALLASLGLTLHRHEHVPDEPEATLAAARQALSEAHLVITIGGVSVGQRDHLPGAWQRLGLQTVVHGVAIQPGKPVFAAVDDCKLVLGLPGNPVSVLCSAHLFLWPLLRRMLVGGEAPLPWRSAVLAEGATGSAKRQVFRVARLQADGSARVITWHGSGDLMHCSTADALVRLPLSDEPAAAGTRVPVLSLL